MVRHHAHEYGQADPWLGSFHVSNNPGAEGQKLVIVYEARANEAVYLHQAVGLLLRGGLTPFLLDTVFSMARGGGFKKVRVVVPAEQAPVAREIIAAWVAEGSDRIKTLERQFFRQLGIAALVIIATAFLAWVGALYFESDWTGALLFALVVGPCAGIPAACLVLYLRSRRKRKDGADDARPSYMDSPSARAGRARRGREDSRDI